jgi:glycosyltransferase involved in cell wall biosynthesis
MKQQSQPNTQNKLLTAAAIPAFNEEKYIGTIVLKARQYVDEVIVVDDGSTDQTAKIARLAGATVLQHPQNMGYGAAIRTILAEGKKREFNALVVLDGDSQHNPDEIPLVLSPLGEGFDLVIGSRAQQKDNIPGYRRVGQKVIGGASRVLSGENLTDSESGFRAFSKKALQLLDLKENGMAVSAETISNATEKGLKITERPISITYTGDSSTLNPVVHGLGVMGRIAVMISERKPLFFFGVGGLILILIGLIAGFRAIGLVFQGSPALNGYSLVSGVLLIIGIFSSFTGIILHTLMRRNS